jgi:hypothetical protein
MPKQKSQPRAKDKRRLTRRLARWRAKQALLNVAAQEPPKTVAS